MMDDNHPIRTDEDYERTLAEIALYFDNQPAIGSPEKDRFDVLAALLEAYEARYYPIAAPDSVQRTSTPLSRRNS